MISHLEAGADNTPVLIFDTVRSSREYMESAVSRLGYTVYSVSGSDAAFSFIVRSDFPVLVLLRADMGENQALDFCELVRNTSVEYQPFILGYAERLNHSTTIELMQAGIDNLLTNLTDQNLLQLNINTALRPLSNQLSASDENRRLKLRNQQLELALKLNDSALFDEDLLELESTMLTPQSRGLAVLPLEIEEQEKRVLTGIPKVLEKQLAQINAPVRFELLCRDGERRWIEQQTVHLEIDEDDQPFRRTTLVRDVTAQSAREHELNEQLALIDQLDRSLTEIITTTDIGIIEVDLASGEVAANQSARRMLFCPFKSASISPELNLTRLLDNLEEENIDTIKALLREVRDSKQAISTTTRVQSLDGRAHNLQVNFTHSTVNPSKISGSIVDLTHQYALLADRDHALEEGKELFQELERQNEERSRLFAIISHEIRTPLASLKMLAEQNRLSEKLLQGAEMESLIDQSLQLLNDLRSVINPEDKEQPRPTEPCSLKQIVDEAIKVVLPILGAEGLRLETDLVDASEDEFGIDRHGLRRILVNLLKNSALHSGGDQVKLTLSLGGESDGLTVFFISIEDNGRGVPDDQVKSLFLPFMQSGEDRSGSGLGLMIVKKLISEMGGSIHYLPSKMGGARFLIELPVNPVSSAKALVTEKIKLDLANSRILYAEDNPTLRKLTEYVLNSFKPKKLVVTTDGSEALKEYTSANGAFDLVITDIFMPNMSGYELTEHLRELGFAGKIVGLTAATLGDETNRLIQLGADDVIEKPLTKEKLL